MLQYVDWRHVLASVYCSIKSLVEQNVFSVLGNGFVGRKWYDCDATHDGLCMRMMLFPKTCSENMEWFLSLTWK